MASASRTCAAASPRSRRRRRSPRPCRWSPRPSCAARRRRPRPRVPMPSAWARCWPIDRRGGRRQRRRAAAAGRHRQGPGASAGRLHRRARPVRRRSTRRSSGWRASDANALIGQGKTVKILCVGSKGRDQLRRDLRQADRRDASSCAACKQIGFEHADDDRREDRRAVRGRRVRRRTLFFSRFKSVIAQIPTAQQLIPPAVRGGASSRRRRAVYEYEPDEEEILADLLPRNIVDADLPRAAGERRLRAGRAHERDGQRHPQRRRHDQQADARPTTARVRRMITKELIEIISGAEAL